MKKLLLILVLIVLALSGCVDKELDAKDLKTLMSNSGKDLDSYRFVTETVQEIKSMENSTEASTLVIKSLDKGAVNLTAQNMSISTSKSASSGSEALPPMKQEVYVIRDMAKVNLDGNWSQAALQDAKYFWALQNVAEKQDMLLNSSQLVLSGSETIEGQDCSRIEVIPDRKAYESVLFEQLGSVLPLAYMNLTKLYKSSTVNWTLWVSKDDGLPRKEDVMMVFSVTSEMMELPDDQINDFMIEIDLNTTTLYMDYNQPLVITLPEGQRIEPIIGCACNR
jgi:outer membrane lipoprotein-sorting protein